MIEDNGDPYNPASAAYIGERAAEAEEADIPPGLGQSISTLTEAVAEAVTMIDRLRAEKAELLAACREAHYMLSRDCPPGGATEQTVQRLEAVIARAEKGR